ncbi:THAP domain-containing protein 5-like [Thalassophryne amazonica]|uniref:THAP domain-containing protein 5-like n=1 Tax=Thalassophryne amazonica TaxID=390379 RepID=UPI001471671C|nr:THAP domain-containing protein 5-like [Thalassophryne amazonica]
MWAFGVLFYFSAGMPRYCAVKVCRNRRGAASSHDNKRISFYPFPLQDKSRLQKWVDNMKREDWTPSRHQYLCSEHFTEDCFDVRWGIRYLKTTSVPTIFPFIQNEGEKNGTTIKRSPKITTETLDSDFDPAGCESPPSKRPLILTRTCKVQSSTTTDNKELTGSTQEGKSEPPSVSESHHAAGEVVSIEQSASGVTVLCCESLDIFSDSMARADPGSALHFLPAKKADEEHVDCISEDWEYSEEELISAYEHSYCKPDTDKQQLWGKIMSLHSKISELSRREKSTVAKIQALETEIALLKRDGAMFKEKQKVLEDCMSSVLL